MGEIVSQVQRVNDRIAEISAARVEQTSGIGQIGDAVTQRDQVTPQNAALVEETAAAAERLKVQAARLAQAMLFFSLDDRAAVVRQPVMKAPGARPAMTPTPTAKRSVASARSAPARQPATETEAWTSFCPRVPPRLDCAPPHPAVPPWRGALVFQQAHPASPAGPRSDSGARPCFDPIR
jgi:hypothetical protein